MRPDVVGTWTGTGSLCPSVRGVAQVAPILDRRMRLGVTQAERARGAIGAVGATAPQGSAESAPVPVWRGRGGAAPTLEKIRGWVGGPSRAQRVLIRSGEGGGYAPSAQGISTLVETRQCGQPRRAPKRSRSPARPMLRGPSEVEPSSDPAGGVGAQPPQRRNPRAGGWARAARRALVRAGYAPSAERISALVGTPVPAVARAVRGRRSSWFTASPRIWRAASVIMLKPCR